MWTKTGNILKYRSSSRVATIKGKKYGAQSEAKQAQQYIM